MGIRNYLMESIEQSLASVPEGRGHVTDTDPDLVGVDQRVNWTHNPECLKLSLHVITGPHTIVSRLTTIEVISNENTDDPVLKLRYERSDSWFDDGESARGPREYEGKGSRLSLIRLGKVAWTLHKAVKVISDPDNEREIAAV